MKGIEPMENYINNFKIKTILTALYQDMESNRKMINMLWQELDKPVKPAAAASPKPAANLTATLQGTYDFLASRSYGVNIRTLATSQNCTVSTMRWRIKELRKLGYNVECKYQGTRKPKYYVRRAG